MEELPQSHKDTSPLALQSYLGRVKNRVETVGVELEGVWRRDISRPIERDGSLFGGKNYIEDPKTGGQLRVGEIGLGPLHPAGVPAVMHQEYPILVNNTCGMHVHMGFRSLRHYQLLMVPEFPATVIAYLREWAEREQLPISHPIWERLSGKSEYCTFDFWPDAQTRKKEKSYRRDPGHRYTAIHYCGRFNTIECRVLPMFKTPTLGARAVLALVDIVNACLFVLGREREPSMETAVTIEFEISQPTEVRHVVAKTSIPKQKRRWFAPSRAPKRKIREIQVPIEHRPVQDRIEPYRIERRNTTGRPEQFPPPPPMNEEEAERWREIRRRLEQANSHIARNVPQPVYGASASTRWTTVTYNSTTDNNE